MLPSNKINVNNLHLPLMVVYRLSHTWLKRAAAGTGSTYEVISNHRLRLYLMMMD